MPVHQVPSFMGSLTPSYARAHLYFDLVTSLSENYQLFLSGSKKRTVFIISAAGLESRSVGGLSVVPCSPRSPRVRAMYLVLLL